MEAIRWLRIFGEVGFSGKMVQLYIREIPVLAICSDKKQHRELLEQIVTENGLQCNGLEGEGYKVVGMGFAGFFDEKDIRLLGESKTYRLKPCKEHLEEIKQSLPEYKLSIMD